MVLQNCKAGLFLTSHYCKVVIALDVLLYNNKVDFIIVQSATVEKF